LPFESWEQLTGESSAAFAAFCSYRDYGPERNIRKAVEAVEQDETKQGKRYRVWRGWSTQYRWRERAGDYDRYIDKLKQAEVRKAIEEQGKEHRRFTGNVLNLTNKRLELMDPSELPLALVMPWGEGAIRLDREAAELPTGKDGKPETKQGELPFTPDFEGL
jgi:hypothetical protein